MPKKRVPFLLLVLALLLAGMPPAGHARAAAPAVYRGRITYMERGPAASIYGLGTTMLLAAATPVAVARVLSLLRKAIEIASGMPGLKEEPSLQAANEWMNEGIPVDLAKEFPIAGAYEATVDFTLKEAGDGAFHLQSGTVQWTTSNALELSAEGATIHDSFSGSGSYALDPARDKIDLRIDHASEPPMFALDVEINHPEPVSGESRWAGPEGTFEITLKADKGEMVMDGSALGIPLAAIGMGPVTIAEASQPQTRLLAYTRRAPLANLRSDVETWRDTFDNQIVVECEVDSACEARIVEPERGGVLTYDASAKGVLEARARADTEPPAAHDALEKLTWTFPDIPGSTLAVDPQDRRGAEVTFRYEGLPARNSQFGEKEIHAAYDPGAACDDSPPQPVRVFFSREGKNNPDGKVPNWFYYWMQTRASQGHGDAIVYTESDKCTSADGKTASGYWDPADPDRIHICNLGPGFGGTNVVTGGEQYGIDYFAGIVRHEWTHLENDRDWWGATGYDPDKDLDGDLVPDDREAALGLSAVMSDTLGIGLRDCEIPAYRAQDTWPVGSADAEDWANPGKQSGGE